MTDSVSEVQPMNVRSSGSIRRRASFVRRSILALTIVGAAGPASAGPQAGRAGGNQRPAQPVGNTNPYSALAARSRYAPYPVKDPTAAERAVIAGRVYRAVLEGWVQSALAPPRPGGGPAGEVALFGPELAERLGRWSIRWQAAEDNAAKSLAGRYQAVTDHLGRMSALEDGRSVRDAAERTGSLAGRTIETKPPGLFADIARAFRPVDEQGLDRVVPELVEVERPINPRGINVTPAERVELAARAYRAILEDAVDRSVASRAAAAGSARRDEGAIFDAALAERLASWSDLWRQAEDAAVPDPSVRSAANRNRSARPAWAGARLAGPDLRPATIRAHIERMIELEDGRFWHDGLKRAGHPPDDPVARTRLREFADVARFFRIEAECQWPDAPRPAGPDATPAGRAAAAGRIYRALCDEAARRYLEMPRAGGSLPDARLVFDARLAERLGAWSIRWGRAQAAAGEDFSSRFAAIRAHIERLAALEDGRSLRDAMTRAGADAARVFAPAVPREFAEVARFFRLEALWERERIRSR